MARTVELLHPFAVVENLDIAEHFVPCIVSALQELVGTRTMELFPTRRIFSCRKQRNLSTKASGSSSPQDRSLVITP